MAINNPGGQSFVDFVTEILTRHPFNDDMIKPPAEDAGRAMHIRPKDMQINKEIDADPTTLMDDQGNYLGQQDPNSLLGLLTNGARPGSLGYFIGRTLNAFGDTKQAGPPAPDSVQREASGAVARGNDLNPVPSAQQRPANLAPVAPPKDYSAPSLLPPAAIPQLRDEVSRKLGVEDATVFEPVDPNGLQGRMNHPTSKVDMRNQQQEMMDISQQFRGAGIAGPIERARPQPQGFDPVRPNRQAKGDRLPQPKRPTPLVTGD